jgi:imidazolonepropionase-like amidohydrolase
MTMEDGVFEKGYVDFENGKIIRAGHVSEAPAAMGEVFDAEGGYILPGLIDAHTHIGISEEGVRWEGDDCNEASDPITPHMRAIDGFYPFDTAIPKAIAGGVTSCAVSPGSTNPIGGQIAAIKLRGDCVDRMIIKAPCAMKFAMGENPKRSYGERHDKMPITRMAVAALIREALIKATRYAEKKKGGEDPYDARSEALLPVLRGEIPAQFHAHRSDDILTAMRLADEFHLRYTIIHASDAEIIADDIRRAGILPIVGPGMVSSGKPETVHGGLHVPKALSERGIEVAITTDHDILPLAYLSVFAALCVREGMDAQAAMRAITINSAKAAGIDERVGSLRPGKDADIAVFTKHPFELTSRTKAVFIDGLRVL